MGKSDVFDRLTTYLDTLGMGIGKKYYKNEEDIKLFSILFTEEEAEIYLALTTEFQTSQIIADKLGMDPEVAEEKTYAMSKKGLIFRQIIDGVRHYRQNAFAHGMSEFSIDRILYEPEVGMALGEFGAAGGEAMFYEQEDPLHRCVPRSPEVVEGGKLLPMDDWREMINARERFAVDRCICQFLDPSCTCVHGEDNKLVYRCLSFDSFADYRVENGIGHYITKEECIKLIEDCIEDNITVAPANSEIVEVFCMCCPDCCQQYKAARAFPGAAVKNVSNYYNYIDESKCINCGACTKHCSLDALTMGDDGKLQYNKELCIGCGNCVVSCPQGASILRLKPEEEIYTPPSGTWHDVYTYQQKKRAAIGLPS